MGSPTPLNTNGPTSVKALPKSGPSLTHPNDPRQSRCQKIVWSMLLRLGSKVCVLLCRQPWLSDNRVLFIALREAVANLYNVTYRQNKASQYTYENVCIVPGGRAGLSRVAAVIGDVYTVSHIGLWTDYHDWCPVLPFICSSKSYQIPDYTAYDQVLSAFKRLVPVPTAWVYQSFNSFCNRHVSFFFECDSKFLRAALFLYWKSPPSSFVVCLSWNGSWLSLDSLDPSVSFNHRL